jgi:hypothetical protein
VVTRQVSPFVPALTGVPTAQPDHGVECTVYPKSLCIMRGWGYSPVSPIPKRMRCRRFRSPAFATPKSSAFISGLFGYVTWFNSGLRSNVS